MNLDEQRFFKVEAGRHKFKKLQKKRKSIQHPVKMNPLVSEKDVQSQQLKNQSLDSLLSDLSTDFSQKQQELTHFKTLNAQISDELKQLKSEVQLKQELKTHLEATESKTNYISLLTLLVLVRHIPPHPFSLKQPLAAKTVQQAPPIPNAIPTAIPNGVYILKAIQTTLKSLNTPTAAVQQPPSDLHVSVLKRHELESAISTNTTLIYQLQQQHLALTTNTSHLQTTLDQQQVDYDALLVIKEESTQQIERIQMELQQMQQLIQENDVLRMDLEMNTKINHDLKAHIAQTTQENTALQVELDALVKMQHELDTQQSLYVGVSDALQHLHGQCVSLLQQSGHQVEMSASITSLLKQLLQIQHEMHDTYDTIHPDLEWVQEQVKEKSSELQQQHEDHTALVGKVADLKQTYDVLIEKQAQLQEYISDIRENNDVLEVEFMALLEVYKQRQMQQTDVTHILDHVQTTAMTYDHLMEAMQVVKEILGLVMKEDALYLTEITDSDSNYEMRAYLEDKQQKLGELVNTFQQISSRYFDSTPTTPPHVNWEDVQTHVERLERLLNEQMMENGKYKIELNKLQQVDLKYAGIVDAYQEMQGENKEYLIKITTLQKRESSYKQAYLRELYYRKDLQYQKQYLTREYLILSKKWELVKGYYEADVGYITQQNEGIHRFKSVCWLLIALGRLKQKRFE